MSSEWNHLSLAMHGILPEKDDFFKATRFLLKKLFVGKFKDLAIQTKMDHQPIPSLFFQVMRLFVFENEFLKKDLMESAVATFKLYFCAIMRKMIVYDDPKADCSVTKRKAYLVQTLDPKTINLGSFNSILENIARICHILTQNEEGETKETSREIYDNVINAIIDVVGSTIKIVEKDENTQPAAKECVQFLRDFTAKIENEANIALTSLGSKWDEFSAFLNYGREVRDDCFKASVDNSIENLAPDLVEKRTVRMSSYYRMTTIYELISNPNLLVKLAPQAKELRETIMSTILTDIESYGKIINLPSNRERLNGLHPQNFLVSSLENMFSTQHAEEDRRRVYKLFYEKLMGRAGALLPQETISPVLKQSCLDFMSNHHDPKSRDKSYSIYSRYYWTIHSLLPILTCRISLEEFFVFRNSVTFEYFMLDYFNVLNFKENVFKQIASAGKLLSSLPYISSQSTLIKVYFEQVAFYIGLGVDENESPEVSISDLVNIKYPKDQLDDLLEQFIDIEVGRLALLLELKEPNACVSVKSINSNIYEVFLKRIQSDDFKSLRQCLSRAIRSEVGVKSTINDQSNLDINLKIPETQTSGKSIIVEIDFETDTKFTVSAYDKPNSTDNSKRGLSFLKDPSNVCKSPSFSVQSCMAPDNLRII